LKILVIHENANPDYPTFRLIKAAKEMGHEPLYVRISRLNVEIKDSIRIFTCNGTELNDYKAGFIRSFGFFTNLLQYQRRIAVLKTLEEIMPLMNPLDALLISRNKLLTLLFLKRNGIRVPYTLSTESMKISYTIATKLGFSVIKPITGSRGYGISLAPNPDTAFLILKTLLSNKHPMLIQEYIKNPGYDIRVIVVGNNVIGAMKRIATRCWKTNIAQGGKGMKYELTTELEKIAIKATKALGLWYAGVDIIEGEDGYYVLEVNGSPNWQEFTKVTGVDPSFEIVNYLVRISSDIEKAT